MHMQTRAGDGAAAREPGQGAAQVQLAPRVARPRAPDRVCTGCGVAPQRQRTAELHQRGGPDVPTMRLTVTLGPAHADLRNAAD